MWHTDYKLLDDGRWFIAYMDDASRFITGFGVFDAATGKHALEVLGRAMEDHGIPASVLTDRGAQFYANESESGKMGRTEFEKELARLDIRHVVARINHPQTNGKLERFHGELQRRLPRFIGASHHRTVRGPSAGHVGDIFHPSRPTDPVARLIRWYNHDRRHMSLKKRRETPARAFQRKMPPPGAKVVTDKQTGEQYRVR